jgi:inhibitor of KinA sporulation pathway (predicted exonuclease)
VKPRFNPQLANFCTELTGITQETVEKGKLIEYVLDDFYKWIESLKFLEEGNYTFVTCGDWDLNNCLRKEAKAKGLKIPKYLKQYINIKKYFVKVLQWK